MSDCQKPGCRTSPSETYKGKHGNTLELCGKHYYELVSGETVRNTVRTPSGGLGIGTDLTTQFEEPETRGVGDILKTDRDIPQGMTPCPDCGNPMGMTTWVEEKPSCHRCQEVNTTRSSGTVDFSNSLLSESNKYTDTDQNDVRIPNPTQGEYIAD